MFVRAKKKSENRWQVQVVESIRDGESVSQKILRNIGTAFSADELVKFREIGEAVIVAIKKSQKPILDFVDPNEFYKPARKRKPVDERARVKDILEDSRLCEGVEDIFGTVYDDMECKSLLDNVSMSDTLKLSVMARIAEPLSKLASSDFIKQKFGRDIPVQKIYRMLDRLADQEDHAKLLMANYTKTVIGGVVDVLFFDVTTLYFESIRQDDLRRFGFSKDCKFGETQVVLALVTTTDGLPVAYDLFAGNTFEGHTLLKMVKKFKSKYLVSNILLVADRGMFSHENLTAMEQENVKYIVAAKLKNGDKSLKNQILNAVDSFKPTVCNNEFCWIAEFPHNGRRLIVSYSSKRASKDRADRLRLVDRLQKKEKNGGIATKDLIGNSGTKKFVSISKGRATINQEKIDYDSQWDGIYGVMTNLTPEERPANQVLEKYRGLWQIEESFRINKHTLKMRPIYHFTPRRIRAHVLLCYLAFSVLRHTQYRLKKRGLNLSVEQIRSEINAVQASIMIDQTNGKRYGIPSKMSDTAKQIYAAFSLTRDCKPFLV